MTADPRTLIDESIRLELLAADLYEAFHHAHSEDAGFWWQLTLEEKNHAALLRSLRDTFAPAGVVPAGLISACAEQLADVNRRLADLVERARRQPPSREDAFRIALEIETAAGEAHYQRFMSDPPSAEHAALFQRLNADDKDHATRIRSYATSQGVPL